MGSFDNMNATLVGRIQALIAAGRQAGFNISPGSGYRNVDQQIALRKKNGCPDVWTSPASSCRVPTAIPGRSNHNHGLAMDLSYGNDAAAAWANANAARFGLHFPVSGENWHVEMIDDDGSRESVNAAQQYGAIGFDVNWLDTPESPEDRQDALIASYMGVITGAQRDALLATPTAPEVDTPMAGQLDSPALAQDFSTESVGSAQVRQDTLTAPGAPGGAGPQAEGDQLSNARIIAQVGRSMGASDQQIKIALSAALVESNLKNVNYGDRDSLGLFQQRPSQGWSSPSEVMNPEYAARKFFENLLKLNPNKYRSPGLMAQAVQRSAYPGRYDDRWGQANAIFNQLGGG